MYSKTVLITGANSGVGFFMRQRVKETKSVTHDPDVAARLWRVSAHLVRLVNLPQTMQPVVGPRKAQLLAV